MSPPGVHAVRLPADWGRRLRIEVAPASAAAGRDETADGEAWRRLCRANPRLHDGPILAVESVDVGGAMMRCRRRSYREYAVQRDPAVGERGMGVLRLLGVKGMVSDGSGRVLLGRRSASAWAYPGMWEIAPAGGVAPPDGAATLGIGDLAAALAAEAREELGVTLEPGRLEPAWLIGDDVARSVDVVLRTSGGAGRTGGAGAPAAAAAAAAASWEYGEVCWCDMGQWRGLDLSPPTVAVLAEM